jgi:hypothetical protein
MAVTLDAGENAAGRQRLWANIKFMLVAGRGLFVDGYLNTTIGLGM